MSNQNECLATDIKSESTDQEMPTVKLNPDEVKIEADLTYDFEQDASGIKQEEIEMKEELIRHVDEAKPSSSTVISARAKRHTAEHCVRDDVKEKEFACNVCEFRTMTRRNLRQHSYIHLDDKPFTCNRCSYKAVCKSYLKRHMATHKEEKPFACRLCEFKTARRARLKIHVTHIHVKDQSFTCDFCDFTSVYKWSLKIHMQRNIAENPFRCYLCEYVTVYKCSLQQHMLKQHHIKYIE